MCTKNRRDMNTPILCVTSVGDYPKTSLSSYDLNTPLLDVTSAGDHPKKKSRFL